MDEMFDPLDYRNLAKSVVSALMENAPGALPPSEPFEGSGVYALYYSGALPFYARVATEECRVPIYVGKAVPPGSRKGGGADGRAGPVLFGRLKEHAKSIEQALNLSIDEFRCRYLVVVPVWIGLAERFLIDHYRPLWNVVLDGFGNHPPGVGRKDMRRPRWDIVHPGRAWAERLIANETVEDLVAIVEEQLNAR